MRFTPLIERLENMMHQVNQRELKNNRIIAEHIRAGAIDKADAYAAENPSILPELEALLKKHGIEVPE